MEIRGDAGRTDLYRRWIERNERRLTGEEIDDEGGDATAGSEEAEG